MPSAIAIHEAGHAVLAAALGVPFTGVEVGCEDDVGTRGMCWLGDDEADADALMVVAAAGEAAVALYDGRHDWGGCESDMRAAGAVAYRACGDAAEARALVLAAYYRSLRLLQQPGVWRAVVAVAEMLDAADALDYADVVGIIEDARAGGPVIAPRRHPITALGEAEAIMALTGLSDDWEEIA